MVSARETREKARAAGAVDLGTKHLLRSPHMFTPCFRSFHAGFGASLICSRSNSAITASGSKTVRPMEVRVSMP